MGWGEQSCYRTSKNTSPLTVCNFSKALPTNHILVGVFFGCVVSCQVTVVQRQRDVRFSLAPGILFEIVQVVLHEEKTYADSVSIHFLSDFSMRRYHNRFFSDPSATDCMSFPLDQHPPFSNPRVLGDIFICPMTALRIAKKATNPYTCSLLFWREITLYLVHGMLHLLGYEDSSPEKRMLMRSRERAILKQLLSQGLIAKGTLRLWRPSATSHGFFVALVLEFKVPW